jgi:hypothetical protein
MPEMSTSLSTEVIIYLGRLSRADSCSLPETSALSREQRKRTTSHSLKKRVLFLLGLAPSRGCLAAHITVSAGGLLHLRFNLTCDQVSPIHRRYVSVARSGRSPRHGYYPALCSEECGLSSALFVEPRSPDQPEVVT